MMKYDKLRESYIELVEAVNDAKTERGHREADLQRNGFAMAVDCLGINHGSMMIDADIHYIKQGIDRPMCGGVFLDWEPSE